MPGAAWGGSTRRSPASRRRSGSAPKTRRPTGTGLWPGSSAGRLDRGWPGYEWRWRERGTEPPRFNAPPWDGSPPEGRTILLYAEQGLGDTIHFVRYAPIVQRLGGRVAVVCQRILVPLLSRCRGIDRLVPEGDPYPGLDAHAALMSLPMILKTTLADIPADVPYLEAEPERVGRWRHELEGFSEFKIGIVWQGNPQFGMDQLRSIPLPAFAPIAGVPGVRLFALQKGPGSEQLRDMGDRLGAIDLTARMDPSAGTFVEEAAALMSLDLLVTSDTAMAHLAGALGRPVWVALPFSADWRWMLDREDSPWYPTMRLFRQPAWGDWNSVFERIAAELPARAG